MKKILALLLALTMVFTLAACGAGGEDDVVGSEVKDFTGGTDSEIVNKDELPDFKIAFSYATFTDKLGGQFRDSLQYLGDNFNVEMVFFEAGSGDDQITNMESTLAAGDIDGVITVGASPALVAVSNKYGVPHICACGYPSLEEEVTGCAAYDNFLGGVIDDDVWAGTKAIEALYDAGCRNICFSGLTQGMVKSHDDRANAMREVVASHDDLNLLADSYTMGENADDVASFHASFPQMDGIGFSAIGDAIYLALESEGMTDGSVKIAGVDISSQTGIYFQNGVQVWTCGGQYGTAMVAWAILYNYLIDGTVIIPDPAEPIIRQYIEITSYEDYVDYVNYVENSLPVYSVDEIAEMIHYFNEDITYQDFLDEATNYSLDDIKTRHEGMIEEIASLDDAAGGETAE